MKNTIVEFSTRRHSNPGYGGNREEMAELTSYHGFQTSPEMSAEVRSWALHWECSFSEAVRRILSVGLVNLPRGRKRRVRG